MENIFKDFVIDNEMHVNELAWSKIKSEYSQDFIIKQISDAILEFNIKLPYREITEIDAKKDYLNLKTLNVNDIVKNGEWDSKFPYKYYYSNMYVDMTTIGNKSSDYFHQSERWKCDATGYPSPQKTWETEKYRLTLFKALFSLKVPEISPAIFRNIISLRKYIAAQFRPSAAKAIYDLYKPKSVLDFSMGWGDRIAGAYASNTVERYVGIDPNDSLLFGYLSQLKFYQSIENEFLNKKKFSAKLYPDCAENEQLIINEEFDMIFTSPPYFDKEKYNQSDLQSYKKYPKFDSWLNDFLFKAITLRSKNLKVGGFLLINISDIYSRKKHFNICDRMNDYITSTGEFEYVGAIGLRMPKRPKSISSNNVGINGEPIWCYKKIEKHEKEI